jgi:26S proteasome regulatory subunit N2
LKKVGVVRKQYASVIGDKHEEVLAKFGAVLGQGIIDAGGRNVTLSLSTKDGHPSMPAIVGMALFTQFWYWYPLSHFLCLSFRATGVIGVNSDLKVPKFEFLVNTKPSLFAYPEKTLPPVTEVVEKVKTAVLSTTAKVKARQKNKEKVQQDVMDVDEVVVGDQDLKKEKVVVKEESFVVVGNLSRVCPLQYSKIGFEGVGVKGRYVPVKKVIFSLFFNFFFFFREGLEGLWWFMILLPRKLWS